MVAEREGYLINIIRADMSNPLPFDDSFFDIIFHPVSNCYVEEVKPIWHECYRVLRKGGILVSGVFYADPPRRRPFKSPGSYEVNQRLSKQLSASVAMMILS